MKDSNRFLTLFFSSSNQSRQTPTFWPKKFSTHHKTFILQFHPSGNLANLRSRWPIQSSNCLLYSFFLAHFSMSPSSQTLADYERHIRYLEEVVNLLLTRPGSIQPPIFSAATSRLISTATSAWRCRSDPRSTRKTPTHVAKAGMLFRYSIHCGLEPLVSAEVGELLMTSWNQGQHCQRSPLRNLTCSVPYSLARNKQCPASTLWLATNVAVLPCPLVRLRTADLNATVTRAAENEPAAFVASNKGLNHPAKPTPPPSLPPVTQPHLQSILLLPPQHLKPLLKSPVDPSAIDPSGVVAPAASSLPVAAGTPVNPSAVVPSDTLTAGGPLSAVVPGPNPRTEKELFGKAEDPSKQHTGINFERYAQPITKGPLQLLPGVIEHLPAASILPPSPHPRYDETFIDEENRIRKHSTTLLSSDTYLSPNYLKTLTSSLDLSLRRPLSGSGLSLSYALDSPINNTQKSSPSHPFSTHELNE